MKKITLLLCLLSSSVFAAENNYLDTMQKNLSNPELYKQHHITIVKEEKHRFLFIPYTKEVIVSDIHLIGTDTVIANQTETPYVASIVKEDQKEPVINNDILKTGLFINISTLNDSNKQMITVQSSRLVALTDYVTEDSKIQLPTVTETSFTNPIVSDSFERSWTDCTGVTYKLKYSGEKTLVKS